MTHRSYVVPDLMLYIKDKTNRMLKENGAFYAFSQSQFNEKKIEGVEYVNLPHGLVCPKENVKTVQTRIDSIVDEGIKQDLEENSVEEIIERVLWSMELNIEDCMRALEGYNIPLEIIIDVYHVVLKEHEEKNY